VLLAVLAVGACGSTIRAKDNPQAATSPSAAASTLRSEVPTGPIPAIGRGWDRSVIHVGVITENDAQKVAEGLGLSDLDPGDQEAAARAAADQVNRTGGIFGRTIVLDFLNEATFSLLASPDTQAAAACTHYAQDRPVVAVVNSVTIIDTPPFKACFAKNHIPVFEGSQQPVDREVLDSFGGDIISILSPSYTDVAPTLVARLSALGYFSRWNDHAGQPGNSPVRVGILTPHDPTGATAAALLSDALTRAGYPPVAVYSYSSSGAGSGTEASAAYQFRARGITHVIGTGLNTYLFMTPAETAGYRPRYGVSTFNAPGVLLENNVPKPQLNGALGIGTDPTADVDDDHDPGAVSPAETRCLAVMRAAKQDFTGKRLAAAVALFDCDVFALLRVSAVAAHGLDAQSIIRGVQLGGPKFVPAETFTSGLGPGEFALAGTARDLGWDTQCLCFQYISTTNHLVTASPTRGS
jgi:hypothetical protein